MNTKLTLSARKPRNPLVAAARLRRAGRHQQSGHTARQQAVLMLRSELNRLRNHSP